MLKRLVLVFAGLVLSAASALTSIQNPGFEAPYSGSGNTVTAARWTPFRVTGSPQFLQSSFEKMDGAACQQIQSNASQYDAGLYQRVSGCVPGKRYRVAGWICTSYDHGFSRVRWSPDGMMTKRIGVDPGGGANPRWRGVIWSWEEPMDRRWRRLMVDFTARAKTVTVFARVCNKGNVGYDLAWIEAFELRPSSFVRVSKIDVRPGATSAEITWTTDAGSDSKVRYWRWHTADSKAKDPKEAIGPSGVTLHTVRLEGLQPATAYYFEVVSKAAGTPAVDETIAGGREFSTLAGK